MSVEVTARLVCQAAPKVLPDERVLGNLLYLCDHARGSVLQPGICKRPREPLKTGTAANVPTLRDRPQIDPYRLARKGVP